VCKGQRGLHDITETEIIKKMVLLRSTLKFLQFYFSCIQRCHYTLFLTVNVFKHLFIMYYCYAILQQHNLYTYIYIYMIE